MIAKFIRHILILTAAVLCGVMLLNYWLDYYSVFRADIARINRNPYLFGYANINYLSMKTLIDNRDKYDSMLMGASRAGKIDPSSIRSGKYFNFWYPYAVPSRQLKEVRRLLEEKVSLKNIVVGFDNSSYLINPDSFNSISRSKLQFRYYPLTTLDTIRFYLIYLVMPPNSRTLQDVFGLHPRVLGPELKDNGALYERGQENKIAADPGAHVSSDRFTRPWPVVNTFRLQETLDDMKALKSLCDKKGIRLVLFLNPVHVTTYLYDSEKDFGNYLEFKRKLADIAPFYDFTGINSITTNNMYYYETSHYRTLVGDMILSKIVNGRPDLCPPDFGVLVTRENVESHLRTQREDFLKHKPAVAAVPSSGSGL